MDRVEADLVHVAGVVDLALVAPGQPGHQHGIVSAAAFPPVLGHFTISANNVLSFAANETQSTGLVEITAITPIVVNV